MASYRYVLFDSYVMVYFELGMIVLITVPREVCVMRTLGAKRRTKFLCVCMTVCILLSVLSGCHTYSGKRYEFGKFDVCLNAEDPAKAIEDLKKCALSS